MSNAPAVVAPHVAVGLSGCLPDDATVCNQLGVGRARKAVDQHGVYHAPNVHQPNNPLLVAGTSHALVLCIESLQNDALEMLVVHPMFNFLEEVKASLQHEFGVIEILTRLNFGADQLRVARTSSALGVTFLLLVRSLLSCMLIACPVFCLHAFESLDYAVGGAARGTKKTARDILIHEFLVC